MSWKIIISGTGPAPAFVTETDVVPPVTPPTTPPPPPPPVVLPPSPPIDESPFNWPPQPPWRENTDPSWRGAGVGEGMYAVETQYVAPTPSHMLAGTIRAGRLGAWDLAGWNLWALHDTRPSAIRRALATGHA